MQQCFWDSTLVMNGVTIRQEEAGASRVASLETVGGFAAQEPTRNTLVKPYLDATPR